MRRLKPSEVPTFRKRLYEEQGGICPLCLEPIELGKRGQVALDHDHVTGEVRGLLHTSCNKVEGSVLQAISTWGKQGKDYDKVIPYLERLIAYLKAEGHGVIYHLHRTEDEKRQLRNLRARKAYAKKRAAQLIK